MGKSQYTHYQEISPSPYAELMALDTDWACDECLDLKRAISAKPESQNFSQEPRLAYFDTKHTCRTCDTIFIFSKEEKRFWYEALNFRIDSTPNHCTTCRKEKRVQKQENIYLSEVLSKPETDINLDELEQIIAIYDRWGKKDKTNHYRSVIRKRRK